MTRAEKATRREAVRGQYIAGVLISEIAERYGITEGYVSMICKDISRQTTHKGYADILRENSKEVLEMRAAGTMVRDIAEKYGVSTHAVKDFCKKNGIKTQVFRNSEDDAARKIRDKSNGLLEYVSGYTIKEKPVRVRCLVCGGEFERTFHNITTKGGVTCPHCVEQERVRCKEAKEAERVAKQERNQTEREAKANERKAEEERKRAERIHSCPVCGTITDRPKYCCSACANKATNKAKDIRRRNLLKINMVDKDITVEGLYRRDFGICWLCGDKCNYEDYTVRNGFFIAGDWYPSIDHVIPLVKGGEHSWTNVRLAHRRCNSEKRDKIISPSVHETL